MHLLKTVKMTIVKEFVYIVVEITLEQRITEILAQGKT